MVRISIAIKKKKQHKASIENELCIKKNPGKNKISNRVNSEFFTQ